MYLTSKKVKSIFLFAACAFIVLTAFRGVFQALIVSLSKGAVNFSKMPHQDEINQLREEKLHYQLKLKQLEGLTQENKILREALKFKEKDSLSLVGTEIIAFSPSSWNKHVFVDAGHDKGVQVNMLVVNKKGHLIGKVIQVHSKRAKVILVKNPDFQTPVSLNNEVSGLLQGSLSGCEVLYVEDAEKVNLDDLVYTALSPFDTSVKVGKVSRIRKPQDSLFFDIGVDVFAQEILPQVVFIVQ